MGGGRVKQNKMRQLYNFGTKIAFPPAPGRLLEYVVHRLPPCGAHGQHDLNRVALVAQRARHRPQRDGAPCGRVAQDHAHWERQRALNVVWGKLGFRVGASGEKGERTDGNEVVRVHPHPQHDSHAVKQRGVRGGDDGDERVSEHVAALGFMGGWGEPKLC